MPWQSTNDALSNGILLKNVEGIKFMAISPLVVFQLIIVIIFSFQVDFAISIVILFTDTPFTGPSIIRKSARGAFVVFVVVDQNAPVFFYYI